MCEHGYDALHRCPWCKHAAPVPHTPGLTGDDYNRQFMHLAYELAHTGQQFTIEDITAQIGVPNQSYANSNNSVGRLMANAIKTFRLRVVDHRKSSNPRSKGRAIPVYQKRRA